MSDLASGDGIRYVHITEGSRIGEKRNFGTNLARGSVVVSWDDDDWCGPGRLRDQIDRMRRQQVSVASYHAMLFTDGKNWWKFEGSKTANLGTSLCYEKSWWSSHPFPTKQVGEDSEIVLAASRQKQLAAVDAGRHLVASIHRGNTSPRSLSNSMWRKVERPDIPGYAEP